jgi:hypothetical protein
MQNSLLVQMLDRSSLKASELRKAAEEWGPRYRELEESLTAEARQDKRLSEQNSCWRPAD